jgi:microcystin-dependent protein
VSQVYVGQIQQGGWTFAPRNTAMCNGQTLAISQNQALFALLGTTYGGNGQTTFQLPDLRGRVMVHQGTLSSSGSTYVIGQQSGTENTSMLTSNMPAHTHVATFANNNSSLAASGPTPKATAAAPTAGAVLGHADDLSGKGALPAIYCPSGTTAPITLGGLNVAGTVTVAPSGSGLPFAILNPYQVVTAVIALFGIFPSRN